MTSATRRLRPRLVAVVAALAGVLALALWFERSSSSSIVGPGGRATVAPVTANRLDELSLRAESQEPERTVVHEAATAAHRADDAEFAHRSHDLVTVVAREVRVIDVPGLRSGRCVTTVRFYDAPRDGGAALYEATCGMDHAGRMSLAFEVEEAARKGATWMELDLRLDAPLGDVPLLEPDSGRRRFALEGTRLFLQPRDELVGVCFTGEDGAVLWDQPLSLLGEAPRSDVDAVGWIGFTRRAFEGLTQVELYTTQRRAVVPTNLVPLDERALFCVPFADFAAWECSLLVTSAADFPKSVALQLEREADTGFVRFDPARRGTTYTIAKESRAWTYDGLPPGRYRIVLRVEGQRGSGGVVAGTADLSVHDFAEVRIGATELHEGLRLTLVLPPGAEEADLGAWCVALDPSADQREWLRLTGGELQFSWYGERPARAAFTAERGPRHPKLLALRWESDSHAILDLSDEVLRSCALLAPDGGSRFEALTARGEAPRDVRWCLQDEASVTHLYWWEGADVSVSPYRVRDETPTRSSTWRKWSEPGGGRVMARDYELFESLETASLAAEVDRVVLAPVAGGGSRLRVQHMSASGLHVWAWFGASAPTSKQREAVVAGAPSQESARSLPYASGDAFRGVEIPARASGVVLHDPERGIAFLGRGEWDSLIDLDALEWR